MYSFCPHCGGSIEQDQQVGKMLVCRYCKKEIGMIQAAPAKIVIDQTEEMLKSGQAGRCPVCQNVVELKKGHCVSHYQAGTKKICQGSGKAAGGNVPAGSGDPRRAQDAQSRPVAAVVPPRIMSTGKDLSKYTTREVIRVVSCQKGAAPRIEQLTLDYLDKNDRVRIQIEALRDILGGDFRMKAYPAGLNRPQLAIWVTANICVAAKKHEQGGIKDLADGEMGGIVEDFKGQNGVFFG